MASNTHVSMHACPEPAVPAWGPRHRPHIYLSLQFVCPHASCLCSVNIDLSLFSVALHHRNASKSVSHIRSDDDGFEVLYQPTKLPVSSDVCEGTWGRTKGAGQPGSCPGRRQRRQDATGVVGNMVPLKSSFHKVKNFSENYRQFWQPLPKEFLYEA
jgi:hypothetical protein